MPLDLGAAPSDQADDVSPWWRHELLHRRVAADPARLLPLYREERNAVEKAWLADPPEPARAFAEGDRLMEDWERRVARKAGTDTRPRFVRRYWRKRTQRACLLLD
mgnify:CR=1 FL=1